MNADLLHRLYAGAAYGQSNVTDLMATAMRLDWTEHPLTQDVCDRVKVLHCYDRADLNLSPTPRVNIYVDSFGRINGLYAPDYKICLILVES